MHFSDGSTLTDREIYPHDLTEEQMKNLTSVERVIVGWHVSILKSEHIRNFFIMTEQTQALKLTPKGGRFSPPPLISIRALGCYLKNSDPPIRIIVGMDVRTKNVTLKADYVKTFRPNGFSALITKRKKKTDDMVQKPVGKNGPIFAIRKEAPVRRVYSTKVGIGCLIGVNKTERVMVEMTRKGNNCHVEITSG